MKTQKIITQEHLGFLALMRSELNRLQRITVQQARDGFKVEPGPLEIGPRGIPHRKSDRKSDREPRRKA